MKIHQWEVWKSCPPGFQKDHWFVIISGNERNENSRLHTVNGLACFTLRGSPAPTEARLNSADGFQAATVCQCDLIFLLEKSRLQSPLGFVSWERQQEIKFKIKQCLRL